MSFSYDEEIYIDDKGKILIENAKKAISIDKNDLSRDSEIERAMNKLYKHFGSYPEEELKKFGFQLKIFEVESMLGNEFLPLNSTPTFNPDSEIQYPTELTSSTNCEQALDFLVHLTRKNLSKFNNLESSTLEKQCMDTSWDFEQTCKHYNLEFTHMGLNQNLKNGSFHHFTIVNFPLNNGESKQYLVDCTYRQFFTKSNSFRERISVMRGPAKGCSIGAYMMMTEERKKIAEELLTKGYIEATPENIKEYFDAIVFSGRDNDYYKQQSLDFMNPNDCTPKYSMADYMRILIENHAIDENSFFAKINKNFTKKDNNKISTRDIGKRSISTNLSDKEIITGVFSKFKNRIKEMGILKSDK